MYGLRDVYSEMEMLHEYRRRASAYRLAKMARSGRGMPLSRLVMARLGRLLSNVGRRLEMEYSA
jgi:hypothetical protein